MFNIAKARLSMPEAVADTKAWFKSRELPNGLFVWQGHGHGTFMPESIGVAAIVTEFLMQSVGDTIRVFPCWPKEQDAKFATCHRAGSWFRQNKGWPGDESGNHLDRWRNLAAVEPMERVGRERQTQPEQRLAFAGPEWS